MNPMRPLLLMSLVALWAPVPAPLSVLYPYGPSAGDTRGPAVDDDKWPLNISAPINLFGMSVEELYLSPDGFIDIYDNPGPEQMLLNYPGSDLLLMAFGADWDFSAGDGQAWYAREVLDGPDLDRATADVNAGLRDNSRQRPGTFFATQVIVGTYVNGSSYPGNGYKRNTVQIVIITDLIQTYVMYNYGHLEWEYSWNFPTRVGYYVIGDPKESYDHPYMDRQRLFDLESWSNVHVDGRLMFQADIACDNEACVNGICLEDSYCLCEDGYTGNSCDTEVNECESNPCTRGTCSDLVEEYVCTCPPGYTGQMCEDEIYFCAPDIPPLGDKCLNGTCQSGLTGFTCRCQDGFTGRQCETEIVECASCPCVHGQCQDRVDHYTCLCDQGYTGRHCDHVLDACRQNPCQHGLCVDLVQGYDCRCHPGYGGRDCQEDLDECNSSPCEHGRCVNGANRFECECHPGFEGLLCQEDVDECDVTPCMHGTCYDGIDHFLCACEQGYSGPLCEQEIQDCDESSCSGHGYCMERVLGSMCQCQRGFTGMQCETDLDDCLSAPCVHGQCHDGSNAYTCMCHEGYNGTLCDQDIDDCLMATCLHGTCTDDVHAFSCNCEPGYTGESCQDNIDDCLPAPCANGFCIDGVESMTCSCYPGFTGQMCEVELNECSSRPCSINGTCKDTINGYVCDCFDGVRGPLCEVDERPAEGSFGAWGAWSTCSKLCDSGLQTRYRQCLRPPCLANNDRVQLCNTIRCQGDPDEFDQMALILETFKTEKEVAEEEVIVKEKIAESLNHCCSQSRAMCCNIVNITYPATSGEFDIFSPDNVRIARSSPFRTDDDKIRIKVSVSVQVGPMRTVCLGREHSATPIDQMLYLPLSILHDCVSTNIQQLNTAACCWSVMSTRRANIVSYILMGTLIPMSLGLLVIVLFSTRTCRRTCRRAWCHRTSRVQSMTPERVRNRRSSITRSTRTTGAVHPLYEYPRDKHA